MKKLLYLFVAMVIVACTSSLDEGEVAARAAKEYYGYLLQGDVASFVDGHYRPDSIPDTYREQLITNTKMYVSQQNEEHRGIKDIRIVDTKTDMQKHAANVFLVLSFGDSTSEEILVPMVESGGVWYLR
ncbi:DUF4878 domain-containing protein [Hoylesella buccalis]|uniref:Uncharacterized protein n=1 Tax=Hoylesella buccalis DNF00853 TaxID=1401074 RepID=A0A096BIC3_9BACT|nr:DUF4878 domain-containing protein [Hoylesella buccalis]KGF32894.1 hypothetical protein HMPREF2137_12865 [Hoylesella buccalis DNF00853]